MAAGPTPPRLAKHYLLTYTLAADYLERRPKFRADHLLLAKAAAERGELLLGGAVEGMEHALLLFRSADRDTAEDFARTDPYVVNGFVSEWRVQEWLTVVGEGAAAPVA